MEAGEPEEAPLSDASQKARETGVETDGADAARIRQELKGADITSFSFFEACHAGEIVVNYDQEALRRLAHADFNILLVHQAGVPTE